MAGRSQLLVPLLLAAMLGACVTTPRRGLDQSAPPRATADPAVVSLREKLAEGARSMIGAKQLLVRGRRFTMDCTGLVLAMYWYAGIDLARDFNKFTGNGVGRIYKTLEREDLLYSTSTPLVGDIIFWDNTYDANEDDSINDPLSHVGMVLKVDDDATITYVHYHIRRGITTDYMNLRNPAVQDQRGFGHIKVINSPLRMAVPGKPHAENWLSGQLYRNLGMGYLLH